MATCGDYTVEWTTTTSASGSDFYVWWPSSRETQAVTDEYAITASCPSMWNVTPVPDSYWEDFAATWEEYKQAMAEAMSVPAETLFGSKSKDPRVEILITFENNHP